MNKKEKKPINIFSKPYSNKNKEFCFCIAAQFVEFNNFIDNLFMPGGKDKKNIDWIAPAFVVGWVTRIDKLITGIVAGFLEDLDEHEFINENFKRKNSSKIERFFDEYFGFNDKKVEKYPDEKIDPDGYAIYVFCIRSLFCVKEIQNVLEYTNIDHAALKELQNLLKWFIRFLFEKVIDTKQKCIISGKSFPEYFKEKKIM